MKKVIPITKNLKRVEKLIKEKELSERDLILILNSYQIKHTVYAFNELYHSLDLKRKWLKTKLPKDLPLDRLIDEDIEYIDVELHQLLGVDKYR